MKKQRKHDTPDEKVTILRTHLLEQVPISELCDKHGVQPTGCPTIQPTRSESPTWRERSTSGTKS